MPECGGGCKAPSRIAGPVGVHVQVNGGGQGTRGTKYGGVPGARREVRSTRGTK